MITTWGYGVASCLCCYNVGVFLPFNDHVINSVAASFVLFGFVFFSKKSVSAFIWWPEQKPSGKRNKEGRILYIQVLSAVCENMDYRMHRLTSWKNLTLAY